MFTAYVLIMTIQGPMKLQDTQGPYLTELECEDRGAEMVVDISRIYTENVGGKILAKNICVESDDESI